MKIVVSGATGFIGRAIVRALLARGDRVVALSRSPERARFPSGIEVARFDPNGTVNAAPFEAADAVVHLAGETVAGRWTQEKKRAIYDSRVVGTRTLVDSIAACARKPRVLVSASAVGYYGDRKDEPLLETSAPGSGFLAEMLPPFQFLAGGPYGNGSQWMPWIHLDDDVDLFLFALDRDISGPLNAVAPDYATSARLASALGHALRRPALAYAPGIALYAVLGRFASTLLASQLVLPDAALCAGFTFKHELLEQALLDIIAPGSGRRPALHHFEDSVVVKAPLDKAFAFFADASNLARLTPPALDFRMRTASPVAMRRGALIEYSLKVRGVRMRWKSLISDWQPGARFTDYQLRGPYALWRHEHEFAEDSGGTRVRDRVAYSLPFAPLGDIALPLVRKDVDKIFEFRREAIARLL